MPESTETEVLVIGGGLAGQAVALALAGGAGGTPVDVVLVDAGDPARYATAAFDGRASALTETSVNMLAALKVWEALRPDAEPMREIRITDSRLGAQARPVLLHFGRELRPGRPSAFMVENRHLHAAMYKQLESCDRLTIRAETRPEHLAFADGHVLAQLSDGSDIRCRLLVGADGRTSSVRSRAGIETVGWSYRQCGIVTTVIHERPHHGIAEEHFLPAGPFAILPLPGNRSSLVWTEAETDARHIAALPDDRFTAELARRFGAHLGRVEPTGPRHVFPLAVQIARDYVAPRVALVGDAAHVIHPIAGLGFNLGLRDAAALAEVVGDGARLGLDIGSLAVLDEYQSWRRFDSLLVALVTDGLNRLFSNDSAMLAAMRRLGLSAVDRATPLKRFFVDEAAGRDQRLPKLMHRPA